MPVQTDLLLTFFLNDPVSCNILCTIPRVVPNARPAPIVTTVVRKRSNCMVAFQPQAAVYMVCN